MICGFCNADFEEDRAQPGCKACPLGSDCGLVRCPHCGFENPATPKVVTFLSGLFGGRAKTPKAPPPESPPRRRSLPVLPASGGGVR